MRIRAFPNNSGSRYWRLEDPFKYLRRNGVDAQVVSGGITERVIQDGDIFVLQGAVDMQGIALLYAYQQEKGKKIVVDQDDYPLLNPDNINREVHEATNALEIVTRTLEIADMVTTTTPFLEKKLNRWNKNTVVLPNYPDLERWDLKKMPKTRRKIRIGWVGSMTHVNDVKMIEKPLKKILGEFKNVQLVIMGDPRVADIFSGYNVECVLGVPFDVYPSKLHGLRLDIGLAPLTDNTFNRCKSNIKWYEYALSHTAGVYSNVVYQKKGFEPQSGIICYHQDNWYQAIKNLIISERLREDVVGGAYARVTGNCSLEDHIDEWINAYNSLIK